MDVRPTRLIGRFDVRLSHGASMRDTWRHKSKSVDETAGQIRDRGHKAGSQGDEDKLVIL